jgi:hypothetical protein
MDSKPRGGLLVCAKATCLATDLGCADSDTCTNFFLLGVHLSSSFPCRLWVVPLAGGAPALLAGVEGPKENYTFYGALRAASVYTSPFTLKCASPTPPALMRTAGVALHRGRRRLPRITS